MGQIKKKNIAAQTFNSFVYQIHKTLLKWMILLEKDYKKKVKGKELLEM